MIINMGDVSLTLPKHIQMTNLLLKTILVHRICIGYSPNPSLIFPICVQRPRLSHPTGKAPGGEKERELFILFPRSLGFLMEEPSTKMMCGYEQTVAEFSDCLCKSGGSCTSIPRHRDACM